MNKSELIAKVTTEASVSQAEAGHNLNAIPSSIGNALKKANNIALIGFDIFKVTAKAALAGRNSSTDASIQIAARNAYTFNAGKTLNDKAI